MGQIKAVIAACIAVGLGTAAPAASVRHHVNSKHVMRAPAPQSFEARYRACRAEAFRKFGWHNGLRPRLWLYRNFAVEQTDYCMRNGGHL